MDQGEATTLRGDDGGAFAGGGGRPCEVCVLFEIPVAAYERLYSGQSFAGVGQRQRV